MRVNVGCGGSPTAGWRNFDNSLTVRLAKIPLLVDCLGTVGLLSKVQREFAAFARTNRVEYADAIRGLPLESGSADVIYSSHMLEHLCRETARAFLGEARRVLRPGGWIRIVVPDLEALIDEYLTRRDADSFIGKTLLASPSSSGIIEKLTLAITGNRGHLWMYDGESLCRLVAACGFVDAQVLPAGSTRIPDPGALNLAERADESVYVEALNP